MLPLGSHLQAGVLGSGPLFTRPVTLDQPRQKRGSAPSPQRAVVRTEGNTETRKALHKPKLGKGQSVSWAAPPSGRDKGAGPHFPAYPSAP